MNNDTFWMILGALVVGMALGAVAAIAGFLIAGAR